MVSFLSATECSVAFGFVWVRSLSIKKIDSLKTLENGLNKIKIEIFSVVTYHSASSNPKSFQFCIKD